MSRAILVVVGIVVAGLATVGLSSVFTVTEGEQALILQLGRPISVVQKAGLNFKLPWQNVVYYDRRLLDFDAASQEVIALDQKRLIVDAFARFRIVDPLEFFKAIGPDPNVLRGRLGAIVVANLRNELGKVPFVTVLTEKRADVMQAIRLGVQRESAAFGINVVDVRIMRADLPAENSQAIYARMQTERQREANQHRAEGAEEAQRIRSEAERDRTILLAEAQKQAQILRGEGDAEAIRVFAQAVSQDPEFFSFYRSLQAYRQAFGEGQTTVVLSPDSQFFRYFRDLKGGQPPE